MKRNLVVMACTLFVLLTSCGQKSPVGTWVQPAQNPGDREEGFVLYKDGTASTVNMRTVVFNSWEQKDDLLIIKGRNTGVYKNSFIDTLRIVKLTEDNIVLSQTGFDEITYTRKN